MPRSPRRTTSPQSIRRSPDEGVGGMDSWSTAGDWAARLLRRVLDPAESEQ